MPVYLSHPLRDTRFGELSLVSNSDEGLAFRRIEDREDRDEIDGRRTVYHLRTVLFVPWEHIIAVDYVMQAWKDGNEGSADGPVPEG